MARPHRTGGLADDLYLSARYPADDLKRSDSIQRCHLSKMNSAISMYFSSGGAGPLPLPATHGMILMGDREGERAGAIPRKRR